MKKSKIAAGVIIALGVVWCGGSWYTGQTIEKHYFEQIEQFNQRIATSGLSAGNKIAYKNVKFERGLFSTHIEDQIEIRSVDQNWILPLSTTLYHGPLPIDRLAKLNLSPTLLSANMLLGKNATTQPLFDVTKSEKPFQLNLMTNYQLNTQADFDFAGGQWQNSQNAHNQASWSPIQLGLSVNPDLDMQYRIQAKNIHLQLADELSNAAVSSLHWEGLHADGHFAPTQWPLIFAGEGKSAVDLFEEKGMDNKGQVQTLTQKNTTSQFVTEVNGDVVNMANNTQIENLALNQADLGKVAYNVALNHIDGNALQQIFDILVTAFKDHRDEPFPEYLAAQLQSAATNILNNQPQIKLDPVAFSSEKGQAELSLNIGLVKNPKFNLMRSGLYKQFSDFSINVNVDKPFAINLLQQIVPENEKELVVQQIEEAAKEGEMNGVVVNNGDKVTLSLVLENQELKLNGHIIPEEQVKMMMFMLLMNSMGQ